MAREVRREDIPEQLQPLFDQLTVELMRVHSIQHSLTRARAWCYLGAGMGVGASLVQVALAIGRGL